MRKDRPSFNWNDDAEGIWHAQDGRELIIGTLDFAPTVSDFSEMVIYGDVKLTTGLHELLDAVERLPHRSRVVQNAPRIDNVELPERGEEFVINNRSLLDYPVVVVGKITAP